METFVLATIGFVLGILASAPIGACQIEVIKRSLHNHLLSALMVVAGSATPDVLYGLIAFFGFAPFLEHKDVVAVFGLVCTVLMWILAYFTLKQSAKPHITNMDMQILKSKRVGYVTGVLLSATNPLTIFYWLIGAKIVIDIKVINRFNSYTYVVFVLAGTLGMMTYLSALAFILHWVHKFISHTTIRRINFILGIILILLSVYFLFTSLKVLIH